MKMITLFRLVHRLFFPAGKNYSKGTYKKNFYSFYLDYIGWIKTKNHLTLLSL